MSNCSDISSIPKGKNSESDRALLIQSLNTWWAGSLRCSGYDWIYQQIYYFGWINL